MVMSRDPKKVQRDRRTNSYGRPEFVHEYSYETGKIVLPVARNAGDPGPRHRVLQVHQPVGFRTVRFEEVKKGTPPLMPPFEDTECDTLIHATLAVAAGINSGQDGYTFAAAGEYLFVQDVFGTGAAAPPADAQGTQAWQGYQGRPRDHTTGFPTGESPRMELPIDMAVYGAGDNGLPNYAHPAGAQSQGVAVISGPKANVGGSAAGGSDPGPAARVADAVNAYAAASIKLTDAEQPYYTTYVSSVFFSSGLIG